MNPSARKALFVVVGLLCGCSGGGNNGSGGGAGGGGGTGGGPGGGGGGGTVNNLKRGAIYVSQAALYGNTVGYGASASFFPDGFALGSADPFCKITVLNGCTVTDCHFDGGGYPLVDAGQRASAGTITVQPSGSSSLTLSATNGSYSAMANGAPWWDGGEALTITASGSDAGVPAFMATLPAPARVALTNTGGGPLAVTQNTALTIGWGGATTGTVQVLLTAGNLNAHRVEVSCEAPGSAGTFSVAAPVTQLLPTGFGSLQLETQSTADTGAGGWTITATASSFTEARITNVQ